MVHGDSQSGSGVYDTLYFPEYSDGSYGGVADYWLATPARGGESGWWVAGRGLLECDTNSGCSEPDFSYYSHFIRPVVSLLPGVKGNKVDGTWNLEKVTN